MIQKISIGPIKGETILDGHVGHSAYVEEHGVGHWTNCSVLHPKACTRPIILLSSLGFVLKNQRELLRGIHTLKDQFIVRKHY